jgi:hypothetical protein
VTAARIKRERTPGWRLAEATSNPLGAVIVDRSSRFGNPFTIAGAQETGYDDPRTAVIGAFVEWLRGDRGLWQSDEGDRRRERILSDLPVMLRGRDVACTCEPGEACHGDELLRLAAMPAGEFEAWAGRVRARVARNREWRGEDPLTPSPASRSGRSRPETAPGGPSRGRTAVPGPEGHATPRTPARRTTTRVAVGGRP